MQLLERKSGLLCGVLFNRDIIWVKTTHVRTLRVPAMDIVLVS